MFYRVLNRPLLITDQEILNKNKKFEFRIFKTQLRVPNIFSNYILPAIFVDTNLLTASTFEISFGERASAKIKSKHTSDMHNTTNPFIANKTSVSKKLIVIGLQRNFRNYFRYLCCSSWVSSFLLRLFLWKCYYASSW